MENIKEIFDAALRDEYSEWHAIDWPLMATQIPPLMATSNSPT
jgi:hypothetical protein